MNWTCLMRGHKTQTVDGKTQKLVYQKGDVRPVVDYYAGIYRYCVRAGCRWNTYSGPRQPYAREVKTGGRV